MPVSGDITLVIPSVSCRSTLPARRIGSYPSFYFRFGEHVIGEEVEYSLLKAAKRKTCGSPIYRNFMSVVVAANRITNGSSNLKTSLPTSGNWRSRSMKPTRKNVYYDDLIRGNILEPLKIRVVRKTGLLII